MPISRFSSWTFKDESGRTTPIIHFFRFQNFQIFVHRLSDKLEDKSSFKGLNKHQAVESVTSLREVLLRA